MFKQDESRVSASAKLSVRRLATYGVGVGLAMTLLLLATAGTAGIVIGAAADQGYNAGGTQASGYGAAGGTLGVGVGSPNTGIGVLLVTAIFLVLVGLVVLGLSAVLSRGRQA